MNAPSSIIIGFVFVLQISALEPNLNSASIGWKSVSYILHPAPIKTCLPMLTLSATVIAVLLIPELLPIVKRPPA